MIDKIEKLLQEARTHVAVEVNNTLLRTYMEIGKLLVEDIDLHENEENYQNKTISMIWILFATEPLYCYVNWKKKTKIWNRNMPLCEK